MVEINPSQPKLSNQAKTQLYRSTYDGFSLENIDMKGNIYRDNITYDKFDGFSS